MIIDHYFHAMIVVIIYEILVFMDEVFTHTFFMTPKSWIPACDTELENSPRQLRATVN